MGGVQRVAAGIASVLGLKGIELLPADMANQVVGTVDLLQFYGATQISTLNANNVALAEGAIVSIQVPNNQHWLLFGAHAAVVKTATMTALRMSISHSMPPGVETVIASEALGPFGATETGTIKFGIVMPYPRLILPGWTLFTQLDILGTDATANVGFAVHVGVLG